MFDKILQAVLRFFGKEKWVCKKSEPPTEDEALEALEKLEALDRIGEPK